MESLSHGLEHTATSGAIPYFKHYFNGYADFNLGRRYRVPFNTLYGLENGGHPIHYLSKDSAAVSYRGKAFSISGYVPPGGSAHFPPNARGHYDLQNDQAVLSTIEDWRIGTGPGGADLAKPFTRGDFGKYGQLAPDCMGPWLIYWRQNMPGLKNRQKDDSGKPMKNWLPFLFY
jgi:hypothetical protein